jgi:UTP pyrophosphatase
MEKCMRYLSGYGPEVIETLLPAFKDGRAEKSFQKKYSSYGQGDVCNDKLLYEYVSQLKKRYLKSAPPLSRICFDKKVSLEKQALGLFSIIPRVQGRKIKSKHTIHIAEQFKKAPEPILRVIVVHELAHLRERDHSKSFYKLCTHIEPEYHSLEFDMRLWLALQDYKSKKKSQIESK